MTDLFLVLGLRREVCTRGGTTKSRSDSFVSRYFLRQSSPLGVLRYALKVEDILINGIRSRSVCFYCIPSELTALALVIYRLCHEHDLRLWGVSSIRRHQSKAPKRPAGVNIRWKSKSQWYHRKCCGKHEIPQLISACQNLESF